MGRRRGFAHPCRIEMRTANTSCAPLLQQLTHEKERSISESATLVTRCHHQQKKAARLLCRAPARESCPPICLCTAQTSAQRPDRDARTHALPHTPVTSIGPLAVLIFILPPSFTSTSWRSESATVNAAGARQHKAHARKIPDPRCSRESQLNADSKQTKAGAVGATALERELHVQCRAARCAPFPRSPTWPSWRRRRALWRPITAAVPPGVSSCPPT